MIHDIINIILALFVCYQFLLYIISNNENFDKNDMNNIDINKLLQLIKDAFLKNRDENAVYNPLAPPEQRVERRQYPYPNNVFGEKTRGEPDDYQLVGLLYNTDINKNYQLYGRRVYPGSYEWEYYIRGKDAGGLDFKFPIQLKNKEEIRDGMQLTVPIDKNVYNVSIYNYDQPRYNPFPNY